MPPSKKLWYPSASQEPRAPRRRPAYAEIFIFRWPVSWRPVSMAQTMTVAAATNRAIPAPAAAPWSCATRTHDATCGGSPSNGEARTPLIVRGAGAAPDPSEETSRGDAAAATWIY